MNNSADNPTLVIDFSNDRIRIHRKTIEALGMPESIILIINPEKLILGIVACKKGTRYSHRIHFSDTHCCELYSKPLINALKYRFSCWDSEKSYQIVGSYHNKHPIACFNLSESTPLKSDEGSIRYDRI